MSHVYNTWTAWCQQMINIDIPGYNFLYVTPSTNAGGVGIYVSDNLILTSLKTTKFLLVLVKNR